MTLRLDARQASGGLVASPNVVDEQIGVDQNACGFHWA